VVSPIDKFANLLNFLSVTTAI